MKRYRAWLAALLFVVMPQAASAELLVTAAGDYAANDNTKNVLDRIAKIAPDVHFALGDLSYNTISEHAWCSMVRERVATPFLLLAGNHDTNGKDGDLDKFIECLPYTMNAPLTGSYAKEYYLDLPKDKPLARFIMISPNISYKGVEYEYRAGSKHARWLAEAIASARAANIPWVIVGMHKVCLSAESKKCEIGEDLANQLAAARVDIVLAGHVHAYERSKQLSCVKKDVFDPACVVADPGYGKGTYFVTNGNGGVKLRATNRKDTEAPYFANFISANEGGYYGVSRLTMDEKNLRVEFVEARTGGILDEFSLTRP